MAPTSKFSFLDNFPEGYQVISPDYKYLYVNAAAAEHGKTTVENLIGKTMMEAYPGIKKTEVFEEIKKCMETNNPKILMNEFTFPNGKTEVFELKMRRIDEGVVVVSENVTENERKLTENGDLFVSMMGREQKMIELKERIKELEDKLGSS